MRLTTVQVDRMIRRVLEALKTQSVIVFKVPEEKAFRRAVETIENEFQKERALDREVNDMIEKLEKQNPGEFERHKMFVLLKKRLAQEKGIVL